jgi:hypothetical protein
MGRSRRADTEGGAGALLGVELGFAPSEADDALLLALHRPDFLDGDV